MAMLSIPSYKNDDPNYRYKMPRLVAKVEGRGNGIRTNIVNMADIARALKRPPDYTTKFCGSELGAQSKFDPAEGKAIVTGAHEQHDLQSIIDKFIQKYVLCHQCALPEIDLMVKKGRVQYQCNACGDKGDSDNTHKLAAFIVKNPPSGGTSTVGTTSSKKKLSKDEKRQMKLSKHQQQNSQESSNEDDEDKSKTKKKKKKAVVPTADGEQEEMDDSISSDDDAVKKKKSQESKKSKSKKKSHHDIIDEIDEDIKYDGEEVKDVVNRLTRFLCQRDDDQNLMNLPINDTTAEEEASINNIKENTTPNGDAWKIGNVTPQEFYEQLRILQMSQNLDHVHKFFVALETLYANKLNGLTATTLEERIKYLKPVASYTTTYDILTALQDFMYLYSDSDMIPEGYKAYAGILYAFYDKGFITSDEILKYYASASISKYCKKHHDAALKAYTNGYNAAQPFLDWLKQEDEEDA